MSSIAVIKVLGTYELLENIPSCLPAKQLFEIQRVSRTWKSVIAQSQPLRKDMFLAPDGWPVFPTLQQPFSGDDTDDYAGRLRLNPFTDLSLLKRRPRHAAEVISHTSFLTCSVRANPSAITDNGITEPYLKVVWTRNKGHEIPSPYVDGISCKGMFLTQPPIVGAEISLGWSHDCTVFNPNGLTFSDALAAMRRVAPDGSEHCTEDELWRQGSIKINVRLPLECEARQQAFDGCAGSAKKGLSCACLNTLVGAEL